MGYCWKSFSVVYCCAFLLYQVQRTAVSLQYRMGGLVGGWIGWWVCPWVDAVGVGGGGCFLRPALQVPRSHSSAFRQLGNDVQRE